MKNKNLPASKWPRVSLGELCELVNGDAYRETDWCSEGVPIIRIQNLNNPDKPFNYWAGSLEDRVVVKPGDVLLAWSGTPGTSFGTHRWTRGVGILNQHIFRVDLDTTRIDSEWAVFSINEQLAEMIDRAHGAVGLRHVTKGECESLPILLPPLQEQKRIASQLREEMAAVENARAAVQAQLDAAQKLPAALLREVFANRVFKSWPITTLGDTAEVVGGMQKTPDRAPREFHKQFLTVRNVQRGYLNLSNVERFEVTQKEFERLRLKRGDLLIVEGNGSVDHIGRNALFNEDGEWIHQNHIIRVRLSQEQFLPEFVSEYLNSEAGCRQMLEKAKSTTGLYTLSTKKIMSLAVPMPPLAEQRAIAARLESELSAAQQLCATLETRLAEIERLPAALLREAFSGAAN